jgi:SAM-dependent methyltransferase
LTNDPTLAILPLEADVTTHPGTDQKLLREKAYADDTQLDIRYRTHQLYTVDPVDFGRWTLERLARQTPWRGDERVLDMGCAGGDLLNEMARHNAGWGALVGFDPSPGMVTKGTQMAAGLPVHLFVGDAQALSIPDGSFDVVMARHMLFHVPDIHRAVAEAARALRPGGRFLSTTNSAHTMPEYWALHARAAARFPAMAQSDQVTTRFSLENGAAFLEPHFDRLETHTLPGTLRFPEAQPFVDYFASTRELIMCPEHTDAEWHAILDFVRAEAEAIIARQGHLDVTKITGAIVAFKGG